MKKIILSCMGILITAISYTQLSISGSFNWTEPGLYYTLGGEFTTNHHRFGIGLNINQSYSPGYSDQVKWNLKPHGFNEYFGLNFSYNYVFYPKFSAIQPYLFADINYQYCGQRLPLSFGNTISAYGEPEPINTFTETIGFGFTTQIYKNIYLNTKLGAGIYQQNRFDNFSFGGTGITYKASVGLTMLLNRNKKD